MDRLLATEPKLNKYYAATDAILLILENRSLEAAERFRDCLASAPVYHSANDEYLDTFCSFWLAVLANQTSIDELNEIVAKASHVKASWWLRRRLRFPSLDTIERTVSEDRSSAPNQFHAALMQSNASKARVSFDF
ncbi:hypothetical protein [Altererythrobacter sp. Z27]|uniref:hypothetical protein n=1 Tax=Altererythrobacter sp. Z27 TaxID=3461147 RepID=UPI004043CF32